VLSPGFGASGIFGTKREKHYLVDSPAGSSRPPSVPRAYGGLCPFAGMHSKNFGICLTLPFFVLGQKGAYSVLGEQGHGG